MSELQKKTIYDKMCHLLTDYENTYEVKAEDLYWMLVEIQNNWEDLTGDN